jgi:GxxExxY protein
LTEYLYQELTHGIIGAAIEVHRTPGPGFPEKAYQLSLEQELRLRGANFEAQKQLYVTYKGVVTAEYFVDILLDDKVIMELKALASLDTAHKAQVLSYLKASGLRVALLLNFDQQRLQKKRIVL